MRPTTAKDSAQDSFLARKVEKLRLKLLDLSGRNALLNFRHRARSRKMIRIVDEVPDLLVQHLLGDSAFQFRALDIPRIEPADEKTARFRRALREAELTDPKYQQEVIALGDDPGPKALERLDQELRSRVRASLSMSARETLVTPSVEEVARRLGIDPSHELPARATDGVARHSDRYLQTLLEPAELDKTLSGVHDQYRSSLDELGINTLFLIVGFLEWYDAPQSQVPLHAPLLLLPLEMSRIATRGRWVTTIAGTDDPAQTNITLRERLKQEQIVLPELKEDTDSAEAYFDEMRLVIGDRPHWTIRRWATVAHLSFARMAMFHDLMDSGWTSGSGTTRTTGVHNQSVVRRILGGVSSGDVGRLPEASASIAPPVDRPVEGSSDTRSRPRVVLDADSSQVAAILDVLDGHDLVVEGPPGTGKSQTIANLIAAAMAEGKSVLFVAEKMAALRVVHDRLRKLGLEPFCLEMHSNRAKRKDVALSIKRRLDLSPIRTQVRDAEDDAERVRADLSAYCQAINGPACRLGVTIHEVLWRIDRVRQRTADVPQSLEQFDPGGADALTMDDIDARVAAMSRLVAARERVTADVSSLDSHPWRGLASEELTAFEAEELAELVNTLAAAARSVERVANEIRPRTRLQSDPTPTTLISVCRPFAELRDPPATVDQRLWSLVSSPKGKRDARSLLERRREYRTARQDTESRFNLSERRLTALRNHLGGLDALARQVPEVGSAELEAEAFAAELDRRKARANQLQAAAARISSFAATMGIESELNPACVARIKSVANLLAVAPAGTPQGRHPCLNRPNASIRLEGAIASMESFRDRQQKIRGSMRDDTGEDPVELERHATALRRGGLFARFRRDYRQARDCYLRLSRTTTPQRSSAMAEALLTLADLIRAERVVKSSEILREVFGDPFHAEVETARRLMEISRWLDRVRLELGANEGDALADRLATAPPQAFQDTVAALPRISDWEVAIPLTDPITTEAVNAATHAIRLEQFMKDAAEVPIPPQVKGRDFAALAGLVRRVHEAEAELARHPLDTFLLAEEHSGRTVPEEQLDVAIRYCEELDRSGARDTAEWLLSEDSGSRSAMLRTLAASAIAHAEKVQSLISRLGQVPNADVAEWLGTTAPDHAKTAHIAECAQRAYSLRPALQRLIDLRRAQKDLDALGCGTLVGTLERAGVDPSLWAESLHRALLRAVVKRAVQASRVLRDLNENRLVQLREKYAALDRDQMLLNAKRLCAQLSARRGEPGVRSGLPRADWTERALLELEANKQKRHIPLRRLFQQAGETAKALMPCFLMSPLSVAQFLPAGLMTFDLVVMDEASQLRPEDALGAIARAGQVVVVGDSKQLPPTNFFVSDNQPTSIDADDQMQLEDDESILDAATAVLPARRRLLWHYRSRHPSLIHFSNSSFYDRSLILFPASGDPSDTLGVRYEHVGDGCWSGRVNLPEARRMVEAAIGFIRQHPSLSLGLVTTNQPQQVLVAEELERRMTEIPEAEEYASKWEKTLEPLFVKNLENVQGDERDVILVSTVYGKNQEGHLHQRFGPINSQVGHRRLNVLFTRAKRHLCVFSSLSPDDIRVDDSSSPGVRAFRDFLSYAKTGQLSGTLLGAREPDSEFEVAVSQRLEALGWEVEKQVGVAGYFIDLAVRHPNKPGRFVLGIECDGARYHSARSVRDRDRLRQQVLEDLGWTIARVWSLDWYRDPASEVRRLDNLLKDLCAMLHS